jgi:adenylate cyclase
LSVEERRLAAVMFTDIVGYTTLTQNDEALTLQLLAEHRGVLRAIFAKHGGTEVKTIGDAFMVEFPSALEAVRCSTDIQQEMRRRNGTLPPDRRIQVRVGVHLGDVIHSQGDILGDAVNISSRIEPLADPGGVCISEQVYDHIRNKIGFPLEKLEGKNLKNVKVPIDVYKIVMPWESRAEEEVVLDTRRVAILPLKNMSPDPNDEYFADGMTEELITSLSSVTELTVIARTSVMQYKTAPKRISDIGRELRVGTLIEGSVRKAGNKVRITIQLIDARNEGHLWAQNYDKQLDDVFTVQSEVAEKVAGALKVKLVDSEKKRIERGASVNPEAYNIYLQGMFYWNKRTPEALKKAAELFEDATRLDPTFALGYAGLAQAYFITASNYYGDPEVYFPKAKDYAQRALSIDDDLAEPHAVLASVHAGNEWDFAKSEAEFKRAIELNPSYPSAHQWYAQLLGSENRKDEAWKEVNRALELSPLSLIINTNLADAYFWEGDYQKGIDQARKVIEMDPAFPAAYQTLIFNCLRASKFEEAEKALETFEKLTDPLEAKVARAYISAWEGKTDEARRLLEGLSDPSLRGQLSPYFLSAVYFKLGDTEKGFELLQRAYEWKDRFIMFMGVDYDLEGVRSDPRYLTMLQKIGLAGLLRN